MHLPDARSMSRLTTMSVECAAKRDRVRRNYTRYVCIWNRSLSSQAARSRLNGKTFHFFGAEKFSDLIYGCKASTEHLLHEYFHVCTNADGPIAFIHLIFRMAKCSSAFFRRRCKWGSQKGVKWRQLVIDFCENKHTSPDAIISSLQCDEQIGVLLSSNQLVLVFRCCCKCVQSEQRTVQSEWERPLSI